MKVLTTAGLTKLIELCKNAIPTVPVTDVTVGGTSVVSSGVAVVPAIPTVNDSTITITQGGVTKGSFTLNQASGDTIALDAGSGGGYHPDLFDWKWADHQLNDVQWLRADTFSWQSGAVYEPAFWDLFYDMQVSTYWYGGGGPAYTKSRTPAAGDAVYLNSDLTTQIGTVDSYDDVNDEITVSGDTYSYMSNTYVTPTTETVAGYSLSVYTGHSGKKIVSVSDETNVANIYTATGVAWYYIIDIPNKRFKLPRAKHNKYADSLGVVGTGMSVGLFDGTDNVGLTQQFWTYTGHFLQANTAAYGTSAGSAYASGTSRNVTVGLTTDASKSGVVAPQTQDTDQYKYLYFYVGNFTQTALENTAGLNAELFNGKADTNLMNTAANVDFVVERQEPTAQNNYTWYRKYKSGWVEQGGVIPTASSQNITVTFPVTMTNTEYTWNLSVADYTGTSSITWNQGCIFNRTTTSFGVKQDNNVRKSWEVKGMAA